MDRVRLEPMTPEQFRAYVEPSIRHFASEQVRYGRWELEGSVEKSRAVFAELLPKGIETPDHFLFQIVAEGISEPVGHLWVNTRRADGSRGAFVYDLEVYERFRRRGFAEAARRSLEAFVRGRGLSSLGLHVFGGNAHAIGLYEKLGYVTTDRLMSKDLGK